MDTRLINMIVFIMSSIIVFALIITLCIPIIGYSIECSIGLICGFILGIAICHINKLLCKSETYIELKCNSMHCINNVRVTKEYHNHIKDNKEINKYIRCPYHKNEVHPCDEILIIYY